MDTGKRNEYAYTLRFHEERALDKQALDRIDECCRATGWSRKETILLMLAGTDAAALMDGLLAVKSQKTGKTPQLQERQLQRRETDAYAGKKTPEAEKKVRETERQEGKSGKGYREPAKLHEALDGSLLDDIFHNFE